MSNNPNEVITIDKENVWEVLDSFFSAAKVDPRSEIPMEFLLEKFYAKFPANFDGSISIKDSDLFNWLNDINNEMIDVALKRLLKEGKLEMLWDADKNDFAFRAVK